MRSPPWGRASTRDVAQSATSATPAPISPTIEAERRQLTVMFCDLVGSTALSARVDPEDLREIIGAYHHRCVPIWYFGYPHAPEDDAERAVRAGLAVVDAVGTLNLEMPPLCRLPPAWLISPGSPSTNRAAVPPTTPRTLQGSSLLSTAAGPSSNLCPTPNRSPGLRAGGDR